MNHSVGVSAPFKVQALFVVLLLIAIFSVLIHWGGYQPTAAVVYTSLIGAVFYLIAWLLSYCFKQMPVTVGEFVFVPWIVYLLFSGLVISVAPWDAWVTIVSQSSGVLFFCVAYRYLRSERAQWLMLAGICGICMTCALAGYYQAYFDYDWGPFGTYRLAQYGQRMAGFFGQPNAYAAFLMLAMPIPLFYVFCGSKNNWIKLAGVLVFLILQWGVLLGVSRGAMITLILLYFLYAYLLGNSWKWRAVTLALLLLTGGVQYLGFSLTQDAANSRISALVEGKGESARAVYFPIAWKLFGDSPVVGVGESSFRYLWEAAVPVSHMTEESHVHSDHLELLAENGVVGVLCYYIPVGTILLYGLFSLKVIESSERRALVKIAIVGLCGYLIHGSVDFLTKYQTILYVSFFYLALIALQTNLAKPIKNAKYRKLIVGVVVLLMGLILSLSYGPVQAVRLCERNRDIQAEIREGVLEERYEVLAQLDEVMGNCTEALEYDPRHVPALLQAIELFYTKARFDEVNRDAYLKQALQVNDAILINYSKMWRGWAMRAELLDRIGGQDAEVLDNYKRAMEIAPENLLLRMNYITYLKRKRIEGEVYEEQVDFVRKTFPGHKALDDL